MSEYKATIVWSRGNAVFTDNRYSRGHAWRFDGGVEVPASSSPHVIPPPLSLTNAVDPEEALVASLASCHMLWFLSIAAKRGFVIDNYEDEAVGIMAKGTDGKWAMTRVTLHPRITYVGEKRPSPDDEQAMHHQSHEQCFIANSVKSEVCCEPRN